MKAERTYFSRVLLEWFGTHGRDLPWRHTHDAYLIWLSEIILQQTRVEQGRGYWERFVRRWPTVELLASATEDEVLREWQGLGYYSRARNLHAAAQQVVAAGGFPRSVEGLLRLRGVGAYTAAAIASFAFGVPAAVVDGNVYRVLSRYFGIDVPIDSTQGQRLFAALAGEMIPADRPADYNAAIMDFGAMQCTPTSPACAECPLAESCAARGAGRVAELPVKQGRTRVQERRLIYIYIRCKGEVAIRKRGAGDFWQGLWEPVLVEEPAAAQGGSYVAEVMKEAAVVAKDVVHVLSHRRLLCDFYLAEPKEKPALPAGYIWVEEQALDDYAKPRLIERLLERLPA